MNASWNWIGIFAWIIVLAYFFWMISNVHHRKKHLLRASLGNHHKHVPVIANQNAEITVFEIILLVFAVFGLRHFHHKTLTNTNSMVTSKVTPLQITHTKINKKKPMKKPHYYYVDIKRTKAKNFKQTYYFMLDSHNVKASNKNALVGLNTDYLLHNDNIPYRVHKELLKHRKALRAHTAIALRSESIYKNTFMNGLGLLSGKKKSYYTVLKVPSHRWIYLNKNKLKSKNVHRVNNK